MVSSNLPQKLKTLLIVYIAILTISNASLIIWTYPNSYGGLFAVFASPAMGLVSLGLFFGITFIIKDKKFKLPTWYYILAIALCWVYAGIVGLIVDQMYKHGGC